MHQDQNVYSACNFCCSSLTPNLIHIHRVPANRQALLAHYCIITQFVSTVCVTQRTHYTTGAVAVQDGKASHGPRKLSSNVKFVLFLSTVTGMQLSNETCSFPYLYDLLLLLCSHPLTAKTFKTRKLSLALQ
jgi:hypothetical protein